METSAALVRCQFDATGPAAGYGGLVRWARRLCQARALSGAALFDGETAALLLEGPDEALREALLALRVACPAVHHVEQLLAADVVPSLGLAWRHGYTEPDALADLGTGLQDLQPLLAIKAFAALLEAAERN